MKHNSLYLNHMLEEIRFIRKAIHGHNFQSFMNDEVLQRACCRSLEIIGEASKNISFPFKEKHPSLEWKNIAGMRDKIIHHYFSVSWNIVWDVTQNHLPLLEKQISHLLKND